MAFGDQLNANAVVEWRGKYLDFDRLRRAVLRCAQEQKQAGDATEERRHLLERQGLFFHRSDDELVDKGVALLVQDMISEVDMVNGFYLEKEAEFEERFKNVKELTKTFSRRYGARNASTAFTAMISQKDSEWRQLKKATIDLYRASKMLENYASLNYEGFFRLVSIFRKARKDSHILEIFLTSCESRPFYAHESLNTLITAIERMYSKYFLNSTISKPEKRVRAAREELNARRHVKNDKDMVLVGLLVGYCVPYFISFLLILIDRFSVIDSDTLTTIIPVFRLIFIPTLALWLWAVDTYFFHRARINYVFIFEFKPQSALTHLQFLKIAAIFSALFVFPFIASYASVSGIEIIPGIVSLDVFPLTLFIIVAILVLLPLKMCYWSSRWMLFKTLASVVVSPFGRLGFRDFFIGDVLTSMVKTLFDLQYTICYFTTGDFLRDTGSVCSSFNNTMLPVWNCLPLFWRLMQCLKRFYTSREKVHLANGLKYCFGMSVVLFSSLEGNYQQYETSWPWTRILWLICFICSTLYMYTWDVFMDWGLGRVKSRYFFLRDKLVWQDHRWFYYYCIISNFFLRFFWTITITPFPIDMGIKPEVLNCITASLEILRRFTWAVIRIENEHLFNCDKFRAVDFIPLPFDRNTAHLSGPAAGADPLTHSMSSFDVPPPPLPPGRLSVQIDSDPFLSSSGPSFEIPDEFVNQL